ncbi:MAG: hypothetical protein KJO07_23305 [Deltaproteobacteria bacterium]|nr:hypothetical protein [Deltaproteobacteria bacterium]
MRRQWLIVVAALGLASPAAGDQGEPLVTLSLSASEVELGAPFFAYLEVSAGPQVEIRLPEELDFGPDIEERGRKLERTTRDSREVYNFEIELLAFAVGELEIPELQVSYASPDGTGEVATATTWIGIRGVLSSDDDQLRELGPVPVVRRNLERVYWALAVAGGVLLLSVLLTVIARVIRVIATRPPPPPPTAIERARRRLNELEPRLEGGDRRRLFVEMSEIVREYVEAELDIAALERATAEIDESVGGTELSEQGRKQLSTWLGEADLVKFAGYQVTAADTRGAFDRASGWIDDTHRALASEEVEGG